MAKKFWNSIYRFEVLLVILLLLVIVISFTNYKQDSVHLLELKKEVDSIKNWKSENVTVQNSKEIIYEKAGKSGTYPFQNEEEIVEKIDALYSKMYTLERHNKEDHEKWYLEYIQFHGVLATFIGLLLGFLGLRAYSKEVTSKYFANLIGQDQAQESIKSILGAKVKNINWRNEIRIKILYKEDCELSPDFIKVMGLFGRKDEEKVKIPISDLGNIPPEVFKNDYDILVIENQNKGGGPDWPVADTRFISDLPKEIQNIGAVISEIETQLRSSNDKEEKTKFKSELINKKNILEGLKNAKYFKDLANQVCENKIGIFFYSSDTFPVKLVEVKKQYKITFANAPAQLYSNLHNFIQYLNEIGEIKQRKT